MTTKNMTYFKENESYSHKLAKELLAEWLSEVHLRVDIESKFCIAGFVWFSPDIACYDDNGLSCMVEVIYKNELSIFKQWRIYKYLQIHELYHVKVYTIDSRWILNQTSKPKQLNLNRVI
jgi:competence CoiA-like predicted nuclease